jgi:hypothetical protein
MRVTLAHIDKRRPFRVQSIFSRESKIGSQVDIFLGLAPYGNPRKQKGIDSTPQCKKDEEALKNLSSRFVS